jgi:hypothetical protein
VFVDTFFVIAVFVGQDTKPNRSDYAKVAESTYAQAPKCTGDTEEAI